MITLFFQFDIGYFVKIFYLQKKSKLKQKCIISYYLFVYFDSVDYRVKTRENKCKLITRNIHKIAENAAVLIVIYKKTSFNKYYTLLLLEDPR